jgi:hypothetical protein
VPNASNLPFKQFKGKPLLEYADQVFVTGWRETPLGSSLLKAIETNDYSLIFPLPFAIDQRYATQGNLYAGLNAAKDFDRIGRFSYFNSKVLILEKEQAKEVSKNSLKLF